MEQRSKGQPFTCMALMRQKDTELSRNAFPGISFLFSNPHIRFISPVRLQYWHKEANAMREKHRHIYLFTLPQLKQWDSCFCHHSVPNRNVLHDVHKRSLAAGILTYDQAA